LIEKLQLGQQLMVFYLGVYLILPNKLTKSETDDLLFATLESL